APARVEPGSVAALARLEEQERSRSSPRQEDVVVWAAPEAAPDEAAPDEAAPEGKHSRHPGSHARRAGSPPTQEHRLRSIVLVGDSQALSLFAAVRSAPGEGLTLHVATRFGCGVAPYVATAEGVTLRPQQPLCGDWVRAREWEIAAAEADMGVLFAGGWEQYDRHVAGRAVSFRDPEWLRLTTRAYRTVLAEMSRQVDHLAVALDHCHDAPEYQLPVTTLYQWGRYPPVVNDPARVAATNRAVRAAAAAFPDVTVLDINALLCANGLTDSIDGVTLRTDGMHWTTDAGRLVWTWMLPRLRAAAAVAVTADEP
ncbi:MAG: SGNH hydrolase domain-containing protein, partial [Nocardioidaceae bacterium]